MFFRRTSSSFFLLLLLLLCSVPATSAQGELTLVETGTINTVNPFDSLTFSIEDRDTSVVIDMRAASGDLDTKVYLLDESGEIVAVNDDRERGVRDSRLVFPNAPLGDYTIIATRYQGREGTTTGDYDLTVEQQRAADEVPLRYDVSDEALMAAGFPDVPARPQAAWTILAYYGGDTNLEAGIITDFNEFELAGGSDDDVRIVSLIDRHPLYSEASDNWSGARLFEIGPDTSGDHLDGTTPTIDSEPLAILDTLDTGNGETFAQFLVWALKHYPADQYAIALASHGAGWAGIIADETDIETLLTLPELNAAFEAAREAANVETFDVLINDACLMSSIEYHNSMSAYFNYSIASPEIVVNPALDMTLFTQILRDTSDVPITEIGTQLVDTYISRDILQRASSDVIYLTHSLTDLSAFEGVRQSLEAFASLINEQPRRYRSAIGAVRSNTYTYTSFANGNELIDLGDFMQGILDATITSAPEVASAAQDVLEALDRANVYGRAGDRARTSTYQNIYFPADGRNFDQNYLLETDLPEWGRMLQTFYNLVEPNVWAASDDAIFFHQPQTPEIHIYNSYPDGAASTAIGYNFSVEIIGRNIAFGDVTYDQIQDDGSIIRRGTQRLLEPVGTEFVNALDTGVNLLNLRWDVRLPELTDGVNANTELFTITEDIAALEGRFRASNSEDATEAEWNDVTLIFGVLDGQLQRVISRAGDDNSLGVIDIEAGSPFQTYSSVVTSDGRAVRELGNSYIWPESGPTWSWQPAPTGNYNIGLLVTTHGGITNFNSTAVSVDNNDVDPAWRLQLRSDFGFGLATPSDFGSLSSISVDALFRHQQSINDAETITQNAFLGFFPGEPVDLRTGLDAIAERYNMTVDEGRSLLTLNSGKTALEFTYTRSNIGGESIPGRGLISLARGNGVNIAIVLATETLDGDIAARDEIFALNRIGSNIFDFGPIERQSTRSWASISPQFSSIPGVSYPLLRSLFVNERDGIWFRHGTGRDINGEDQAYVAVLEGETADPDALLDRLLDTEISVRRDNINELDRSFYPGVFHSWDAVIFEAERDGDPVLGRLYVTYANDNAYIVWVEAARNGDADDIFRRVLEPIIDGFSIASNT